MSPSKIDRNPEQNEKLLTEVELELMNILWSLGEGSVNQVIEQLPPDRDLAYTSVSTILRILEQKKILKTRKEGRGHIYTPILLRDEFEARTVRHVVEKVFAGTPVSLVRQLLNSGELTASELAEIQKMISQAEVKS